MHWVYNITFYRILIFVTVHVFSTSLLVLIICRNPQSIWGSPYPCLPNQEGFARVPEIIHLLTRRAGFGYDGIGWYAIALIIFFSLRMFRQ